MSQYPDPDPSLIPQGTKGCLTVSFPFPGEDGISQKQADAMQELVNAMGGIADRYGLTGPQAFHCLLVTAFNVAWHGGAGSPENIERMFGVVVGTLRTHAENIETMSREKPLA